MWNATTADPPKGNADGNTWESERILLSHRFSKICQHVSNRALAQGHGRAIGYSGLAIFRGSRDQGYLQYDSASLMNLLLAYVAGGVSDSQEADLRQREAQCALTLALRRHHSC